MNFRIILSYFFIVMIGYGCAGINSTPLDKKQMLEQRVKDYIAAKETEAYDKEYEFFTSDYKSRVSLVKFIQSRRSKLDNIFLKDIEYSPEEKSAIVKIELNMNAMGFNINGLILSQPWVYIDGQWYYDAKAEGFKQLLAPAQPPAKKSGK